MRTTLFVILLTLMAFTSRAQQAGVSNVYSNAFLGLSVSKPGDWFFHHIEPPLNDGKPPATKQDFATLLEKYSKTPRVLAITKFQEPIDALNSSLIIDVTPWEGVSADHAKPFLDALMERQKAKFEKFKTITPARMTTLQGQKAAYAKFQGDVEYKGRMFPFVLDLWIIPRSDHILMVALEMPQAGSAERRKEFDPILKSLKLEPIRVTR